MQRLTGILFFLRLLLSAIELGLFHLSLPDFGEPGLQHGLTLLLQPLSFIALVCGLKKRDHLV